MRRAEKNMNNKVFSKFNVAASFKFLLNFSVITSLK